MSRSLPYFDIVLAATKKGGIGLKGSLPWRLPLETKYYRLLTDSVTLPNKKNAQIMGKGTWDDFKHVEKLGNRVAVVISRSLTQREVSAGRTPGSAYVVRSLDEALAFVRDELRDSVENVHFIGGTHLFEEAAHHAQCRDFYLTRIGVECACDAYLPHGYLDNFDHVETSKTFVQNDIPFAFARLTAKQYGGTRGANSAPDWAFAHAHEEKQYLDVLSEVMANGSHSVDRTQVGTVSKFGRVMRFDLRDSVFPLLTTKKVFFRGVAEELLWFISGSTDARVLREKGVGIWEGNASSHWEKFKNTPGWREGDLGPVYGFQWRHFGAPYRGADAGYTGQGVDQLAQLIEGLKNNPHGRRHVLSAWNPVDMPQMALPPCHVLQQFYVDAKDGTLSCAMYQRSCDMGLGVPFNVASYALLTCMIAHVCGLARGELVHVLGDCHVYQNHIEPLKEQVKRAPLPFPLLKIKRSVSSIDDFRFDDFELHGYDPYPAIKMPMAV